MLFNSITRCNISRFRSNFSYLHIRCLTSLDIVPCIPGGDWSGTRRLSTSIEKPRKTHRETRVLRTLRPERLSTVGQEILDLSGKNSATLHFLTKHPCPAVKLRYASKHTAPWYNSFPENTRGFLYYHHSPNMPKLSGSVHFRICDSPELFDSGRDLLSLKGDAWGYKDPNLIKDLIAWDFCLYCEMKNSLMRNS
ncbi:hypothetical protein BJ912DRAFT_628924 [Pholiota molesta]|nr:hypothetical protein BJ912DRAFT_628924 [Pholiota molesta]